MLQRAVEIEPSFPPTPSTAPKKNTKDARCKILVPRACLYPVSRSPKPRCSWEWEGVAHKFPLQISKMISFAYNSENGVNVFWKNILLRNLFYFCKKKCVFTKDSSAMTKFIKTSHSSFLSRSSVFSSLESVVCIFTLFLPLQAVFWIFRERRGEKTLGIRLKTNEWSGGKSFLNKHS